MNSAHVGKIDMFRTSGRSMLPLIRAGTLVRMRRAGVEDVEPGDVIVFRRDQRLIAHRLIEKQKHASGWRLREKGDNQFMAAWIEPDTLTGQALDASTMSEFCSLDHARATFRLRAWIRYSRMEADLMDVYLRLRRRASWIVIPAIAVGALAYPFHRLLTQILLSAHERRRRPERQEELLMAVECLRLAAGDPATKRLKPASAQDWTSWMELIGLHGFLAFARQAFEDSPDMPPDVAHVLKQAPYGVALAHVSAVRVLARIESGFAAAGVDYAVLKGSTLQALLYKKLFPREYEDVDLLVRRRDVDRALTLLRDIGYHPVGGRLIRWFLRHAHFHLTLHAFAKGYPPIELHWALVDRANLYRVPDEEVIGRIIPIEADGGRFRMLAPEDEFIYLCLHAAKHGVLNASGLRRGEPAEWFVRASVGNRLLWFLDLSLYLKTLGARMDWKEVERRIRDWNVAADVETCLRVLEILIPSSQARTTLDRLFPGRIERRDGSARAAGIERWMESGMKMNPMFFIRPARLLTLCRLLFPPPEDLLRYHRRTGRAWLPVLYAVHPFHMIGKILRR